MGGKRIETNARIGADRAGLPAGTRIATPLGERAVETLRPGDLVLTRDHGFQPLLRLEVGRSEAVDAPLQLMPAALPGLERALRLPPRQR
ncbi:Hint domain-containing protein, partial [Limimaricola sp. ASW11-118]